VPIVYLFTMRTLVLLFLSLPLFAKDLVVSADGSGDYRTIQEAVMAVRDHSQEKVKIIIKEGVYPEKLVIPSWKPNLHLVGEGKVRIIGDDYSGKPLPRRDAVGNSVFVTYTTYVVLVDADHITFENLIIENIAGPISQAVALHVEGDKFEARNCTFLGHQDTLFASREGSRQHYTDCRIEGTTDFIFGKAIAVFERCHIHSKKKSYITAAATPKGQAFGFVFFDCTLTADPGIKDVYLGRPWRPYAQTVFIRTEMGAHIHPDGWDNWRDPENEKTVFYAEFGSRGPGARKKRVKWAKTISKVEQYKVREIFKGWK
jgi:pectinesterase